MSDFRFELPDRASTTTRPSSSSPSPRAGRAAPADAAPVRPARAGLSGPHQRPRSPLLGARHRAAARGPAADQDEGINLAGIKRILELETQVDALRARIAELQAELDATRAEMGRREAAVHASYKRELVPFTPSNAVVRWDDERRNRP